MVLVPRGHKIPGGYEKKQVFETPVRRIVVSSGFNVSLLKALGVLDTLVGVTHEKKYWTIDEVIQGVCVLSSFYLCFSTEKKEQMNI